MHRRWFLRGGGLNLSEMVFLVVFTHARYRGRVLEEMLPHNPSSCTGGLCLDSVLFLRQVYEWLTCPH